MKAVVVYESMYGNTREAAQHVGEGLRAAGVQTVVVPVAEATSQVLSAADLVVVGGPTHVHAMTRAGTRKSAVDQAGKHGLAVEPGAGGPGLREWFETMPRVQGIAAAGFDTRLDGPKTLTGQASHGIARRLRGHGFRVVAPPESFIVDKQPTLVPGEPERAAQWGRTLAGIAHVPTPAQI